jgi:hypothetical protein
VSTTHQLRRRRSAVALIGMLLLSALPASPVAASSAGQTPPFGQDWHDTTLITNVDDWSGVPGFVGYLGQDITTATGRDPQTLLTDSTVANDIDVINDIPPAVNIQNGGVGEFELDDAVIGLQPDGIADAPYLLLNLQTTGFRNVAVSYVLRDIDFSPDNAVQPFALQYRVGSSGLWTNIPAGFVADATTGPSLATLVTPVNVTLPSGANDKALVQVRIITANAVPRDEWVGVDNIEVGATALDKAPAVLATSPVGGTADVARDANLSVTFDEPVDVAGGWFTLSCATSLGHAATVSGGPVTFALDPDTDLAYGESCTFSVYAQNVTDQDTDDPPNLMGADYVATFQTVAAPPDQAPGVQSTSPDNGATDVARDASLSVTFDEPVDVTAGSFSIACSTTFAHAMNITGGPLTFTLQPFNDFAYDDSCTLTVRSENVSDTDTDDPPDLMVADYVVTFQTVAAPPVIDDAPTVQSTSPGNGAVDVVRGADLSVTFDEPVDVSGDWFDITCSTSHGHTAAVNGGPVTFSLDPAAGFAYDETCTFTISAQNVTDQDTNDPPNQMAAGHVTTFQTEAAPPEPPKPPTVDAGGPYDVTVGGSVVVSATGSQPDGQALTYRWDLDDNGTFETPGQSVTFSAVGLPAPVTRTIAVRVTAPTGLTDRDEATVNVAAIDDDFAFDGFRGLKNLPDVNEANLGTQFIRFSLGGNRGLDIFKNDHPMSASYPCGSTPPSVGNEPTRFQGASGFRYDPATDEYTFKWNVDKSWKNTCRVFVLGLNDGSTHNVAFRFGPAPDTLLKIK